MTLSESEVLTFLCAIEEGTITLTPTIDPQEVYAGDVRYIASNGWKITIFNDCNDWDYVDCIKTNDGRRIEFDELEAYPMIKNYRPSDEVAWICYRIPGYMKYREWEELQP